MPHCKQYKQKFRQQWLEDDNFKTWLVEIPGDSSKGYCTCCLHPVNAKHSDLLKHLSCKRHNRNAANRGRDQPSILENDDEHGPVIKIKANMSRHVPLNCRDPFFRDWNRDFFGDSSSNRQQNWGEASQSKLFDQHFGGGIWPDDTPSGTSSLYFRSRRTPRDKSGVSVISNPKDKFTVLLEVPQFLPDELKVRVSGTVLEIEGKHPERHDEHGAVSRQFLRKYDLPEDVMVDMISSALSADGVLTIEAPKKPPEPVRPAEREVPIQKMERPHT